MGCFSTPYTSLDCHLCDRRGSWVSDMKDAMQGLSQNPMFAGVNPIEVVRLTQNLPRRRFRRGEQIIAQKDRGHNAYILVDGKVEVFYLSREGVKTTILFHNAPFVFGEVEVWEQHPYLANVVAMEPCEVVVLSRKDYFQLLHSNHQVCLNMVRLLSNLLWVTGNDRRVKFFGRVEHLLANLLCSLAQLHGEEHEYGILLGKDINKSEWAEILGVARPSVIRAFKELVKLKLVMTQGKSVIIPDLHALHRKAQDL